MSKDVKWKALSWVAAAAAAWAGRQAATRVWARVSDEEAPVNPADRSISWGEAAGWALLAGLSAASARVLARRGAAAVWERAIGEAPPEVKTA